MHFNVLTFINFFDVRVLHLFQKFQRLSLHLTYYITLHYLLTYICGRAAVSEEDRASVESLYRRVSELNTSLTETRLRTDNDRRRVDDLRAVYTGWDERSRHLEITLLNSSLEHCRRANAELLVDVQLTQLTDKTNALDGKTTQLTSSVERYIPAAAKTYPLEFFCHFRSNTWEF